MKNLIAIIFCVVCLFAVALVRAQTSGRATQGRTMGGYYGAPQGPYGAPQGPYGAPQGPYGQPQGPYGAPQFIPQGAVASPGVLPTPRVLPSPGTIGVPSVPGVPITVCMNRNPPEGTVITRSVRDPGCKGQCESDLVIPMSDRMVICRGQSIPKGYEIELLTSTPDCACVGSGQNAYTIKAQTEEQKLPFNIPR